MGFILQTQRRAIEAVFEKQNIVLTKGLSCFLENAELTLLGVSEGVGTCSDRKFHGINIAVLRRTNELNGPKASGQKTTLRTKFAIEGAVLLRKKSGDETDDEFVDTSLCMVIEGLRVKSANKEKIVFASNGRTKMYIPI